MRHFLEITDLTSAEILAVLDRADFLQKCWRENRMPQSLTDQKIALWFWGNGFRNRMAFEIGARSMGADISFVPGELGVQEPLGDIGHYLQNWFSMLVIRAENHNDLINVANYIDMPVINARTNYNHPCEIIGDLQYIRLKRGSLEGLNVVFVGEATNLCMSWFEAAARLPINVTQVAPKGYEVNQSLLNKLSHNASGRFYISNDLEETITKNVDVIYTDCWPKQKDQDKIKAEFLPYQINGPVLQRMNQNGFFLPCPPVTRGEEVSDDAMRSNLCQDYAAKEFLLHSQNAIMEFVAAERLKG